MLDFIVSVPDHYRLIFDQFACHGIKKVHEVNSPAGTITALEGSPPLITVEWSPPWNDTSRIAFSSFLLLLFRVLAVHVNVSHII